MNAETARELLAQDLTHWKRYGPESPAEFLDYLLTQRREELSVLLGKHRPITAGLVQVVAVVLPDGSLLLLSEPEQVETVLRKWRNYGSLLLLSEPEQVETVLREWRNNSGGVATIEGDDVQ